MHTITMLFIDRYGYSASALADAMSGGPNTVKLERKLKNHTGVNAVALSSADAALHTALFLSGVRDGDYVFVPSFTFYSYIAAVDYIGGIPVFLDCDPTTRCVSPHALETALVWAQLQDKPPRTVIVDNAFGSIADYDVLLPLCRSWNVNMIELACDAFSGNYKGRRCGANGDYGVLAFDKRLAGGGGALLCGDDTEKAKQFARIVYSESENHDYRMNDFIAALDIAQFETSEKLTARARKNLAALCESTDKIVPPTDGDAATYALCRAANRMNELKNAGFDVKKPPPVHTLPKYRDNFYFEHEKGYSACEHFSDCCLVSMDISLLQRIRLAKIIGN